VEVATASVSLVAFKRDVKTLLVCSNHRHIGLEPLGGVFGSHCSRRAQGSDCIDRFGDPSSNLYRCSFECEHTQTALAEECLPRSEGGASRGEDWLAHMQDRLLSNFGKSQVLIAQQPVLGEVRCSRFGILLELYCEDTPYCRQVNLQDHLHPLILVARWGESLNHTPAAARDRTQPPIVPCCA
jgi:hypothetical protein